jgi:hypothetical protein
MLNFIAHSKEARQRTVKALLELQQRLPNRLCVVVPVTVGFGDPVWGCCVWFGLV